MPTRSFRSLLPAAFLLLAAACTAPRAVINSGKVTPQGQFKVGGDMVFNIGTRTISELGGAVKDEVAAAAGKDTVNYSQRFVRIQTAAIAYILDPIQPSSDFYIRYGALPRVDVGYKYAFGAHAFDAMYQFLGSTGTPENPQGQSGETSGSIGLQFATQRAKLPNVPFLDDVASLLNFGATRRDLMVPLIFSTSLGREEEIGAISYGAVYNHTFIAYGFNPTKVFLPGTNTKIGELKAKNNFASFGLFVNGKFGYRYAYILPALAVYYQNYGTYQLLNQASTTKLKGVTIIPSLGVQFRIPTGRGR
ncbi:hypothetical protein FY528_06405 [Hymenobacter lutimineralis]|uniref:Outer membrane beta-barrel protein n=1 Tax=Hymenobacter lutimineralis TaxID=2606448 RepID=A0A5D6V9R5_9BACT|nr:MULTISPECIES: hypothetical protein [Hymenobacter]QIX62461.1 hypothetical protein HER32_15235 [Hymenobacter sp. BT18]TYZ11975.1 hypothetical protein FY528_06405 [Hymenobacter lutimineralis]